jgi:hypothetical protein
MTTAVRTSSPTIKYDGDNDDGDLVQLIYWRYCQELWPVTGKH